MLWYFFPSECKVIPGDSTDQSRKKKKTSRKVKVFWWEFASWLSSRHIIDRIRRGHTYPPPPTHTHAHTHTHAPPTHPSSRNATCPIRYGSFVTFMWHVVVWNTPQMCQVFLHLTLSHHPSPPDPVTVATLDSQHPVAKDNRKAFSATPLLSVPRVFRHRSPLLGGGGRGGGASAVTHKTLHDIFPPSF